MKKYTKKKAETVIKKIMANFKRGKNKNNDFIKPWFEDGYTCVTDGHQLYCFSDKFDELDMNSQTITLFARQTEWLRKLPTDSGVYYHKVDAPDYDDVSKACKGWNIGDCPYRVAYDGGSPYANPKFLKNALDVFPGADWYVGWDMGSGKSRKTPVLVVHPNGRALILPITTNIPEVETYVMPSCYLNMHEDMLYAWEAPLCEPEPIEELMKIVNANVGDKFIVGSESGYSEVVEIGSRCGKKIMITQKYPHGYVISTRASVRKHLWWDIRVTKVEESEPAKENNEVGGLEPETYRYGMRLRGFSPACQPKEGFIERQDDTSGKYWDVLVYDRKLTKSELDAYDLDELD